MKTKLLALLILLATVLHCPAPIPYIVSISGNGTNLSLNGTVANGNTNFVVTQYFGNTNANGLWQIAGNTTLGATVLATPYYTNTCGCGANAWLLVNDNQLQEDATHQWYLASGNDLTNFHPAYATANATPTGGWGIYQDGAAASNGWTVILGNAYFGSTFPTPAITSSNVGVTLYGGMLLGWNAMIASVITNNGSFGSSTAPLAMLSASVTQPDGSLNPMAALGMEANPGSVNTNGDLLIFGHNGAGATFANIGGIDFFDLSIQNSEQRASLVRARTPDGTGLHGGYLDLFCAVKPATFLYSMHGWTNGEWYFTNSASTALLGAPPNPNVAVEVDVRGAQFDGPIIANGGFDGPTNGSVVIITNGPAGLANGSTAKLDTWANYVSGMVTISNAGTITIGTNLVSVQFGANSPYKHYMHVVICDAACSSATIGKDNTGEINNWSVGTNGPGGFSICSRQSLTSTSTNLILFYHADGQ